MKKKICIIAVVFIIIVLLFYKKVILNQKQDIGDKKLINNEKALTPTLSQGEREKNKKEQNYENIEKNKNLSEKMDNPHPNPLPRGEGEEQKKKNIEEIKNLSEKTDNSYPVSTLKEREAEQEVNKNIKISRLEYFSNIENLIKINWIDDLKSVYIWKRVFEPIFFKWNVFVKIKKYTINEWEYNIIFNLNNWNPIEYDKKIHFWESDSKNIFISNIVPNILKNNKRSNVVLQWRWFSKIISIQLSHNLILAKADFKIINDNVMSLSIPRWLKTGKYFLNIMSTYWIYKSELNIEIVD